MHRKIGTRLLLSFAFALGTMGCRASKVDGDQKTPPVESKAKNPHAVDPSIDPKGRTCHPAFRDGTCTQNFAQVTTCEGKADATLLRPGLTAGPADEGCYYFCPDVPNCESLTLEEAAELACKYAEANEFHPALSVRSLCGPEADSGFGRCCFGLDITTMYD